MKTQHEVERLWTPADLAMRWGCSISTVMDRVRTRNIPYLWLGSGEAKLTGRGAKMVRFRPEAISKWEAAQEGYWEKAGGNTVPAVTSRLLARPSLLRGQKAKRPGA